MSAYVLKSDPKTYIVLDANGKVTAYSGDKPYEANTEEWDVYPSVEAATLALNKPVNIKQDKSKELYAGLLKAGRSEEVARRASRFEG